MTVNNKKSYGDYLDKLEDEYNNNYDHSIAKKSIDPHYFYMSEKIETNPEALKFKVVDRVRIT